MVKASALGGAMAKRWWSYQDQSTAHRAHCPTGIPTSASQSALEFQKSLRHHVVRNGTKVAKLGTAHYSWSFSTAIEDEPHSLPLSYASPE